MVTKLAVGSNHSCVVVQPHDGELNERVVYCWGDNGNRQLGTDLPPWDGNYTEIFRQQNQRILSLAAGGDSACITSEANQTTSLMCWGNNGFGQLGVDPIENPTVVPGGFLAPPFQPRPDATPSINGSTTCFINEESNVLCMGSNRNGIIDRDRVIEGITPVPFATDVSTIALGGTSACMIRPHEGNPTVYCWGDATMGRLGTVVQPRQRFLPQ
jgi:alpha-tubulin suppressor-like RCC1 family protein